MVEAGLRSYPGRFRYNPPGGRLDARRGPFVSCFASTLATKSLLGSMTAAWHTGGGYAQAGQELPGITWRQVILDKMYAKHEREVDGSLKRA